MIFVGAIMLPTIVLGYLAVRTAETEKLVVWEKLEKSYTSLAGAISDELDDILSTAEGDFQNSLSTLPNYDRDTLKRLSYQIGDRHNVIGQAFFLHADGSIIFPEDPEGRRQKPQIALRKISQEDQNIAGYYIEQAERQEYRHKDFKRAIDEYERLQSKLKAPVYQIAALNGIARCNMKMGLSQEAIKHYRNIISKYADMDDKWANIPAIAYIQIASLHEKLGDTSSAVKALVELYDNLANSKWNMDAAEMTYFADVTQERLLVYKDREDIQFDDMADQFSEIETNVEHEVKLRQFLDDYKHLAAEEMILIAENSFGSSESMEHLTKYTSMHGPYLLSYLIDSSAETEDTTGIIAGFEVDLDYLASAGFKEVLRGFTVEGDVILTILDEDGEIIEATHTLSGQGLDPDEITPPGEPIAITSLKALPFWKVGIYVKNPLALERLSRRNANLRAFLIAGLILAIAFGIYLSLREARRETEMAQLRSDFVANVSHELRTPLSSIQIFSETLKQNRAVSQDKQEQYLDTISSESDRLARLVDNVLDFSRLERSVKEFHFQSTNIGEIVSSAVEAYKLYADQRDVSVSLKMIADLPEIQADKEALSQVVMNLIDNALKYSEENGEITVNAFCKGKNIVIQVVDKGVGIDEEDIRKIFDKFYRGKNVANLGTGGTGLGLTLAKAVAIAHGGNITVRSKKGEGSKFSIILPTE